MIRIFFYISILLIISASCQNPVQKDLSDISLQKKRENEALINMNNYVVRRNRDLIERFVNRTGFNMQETGSGLWIEIYSRGAGKKVEIDNWVEISFMLQSLDGTVLDSSYNRKIANFRVGKAAVVSGLVEGVLLLHEGDSARIIIPPHLAYGNFGDQQNIAPGTFLFYDVFLRKVKP